MKKSPLPHGVTFHKRKVRNRYSARLWAHGRILNLGYFETPEEASGRVSSEAKKLGITPPWTLSLEERFYSRVKKTESCWIWTGSKIKAGYGIVSIRKAVRKLAHRFHWELKVGPIPEGLVIDHICRNTSCVNLEHLRVVTQKENVRSSKRYDKERLL